MTTPRPALDGHPGTVLPAVDDPDGETLTRVLDGLRDLPQQSRPRRAGDDGDDAGTGGTPAVPLPRRRRASSPG